MTALRQAGGSNKAAPLWIMALETAELAALPVAQIADALVAACLTIGKGPLEVPFQTPLLDRPSFLSNPIYAKRYQLVGTILSVARSADAMVAACLSIGKGSLEVPFQISSRDRLGSPFKAISFKPCIITDQTPVPPPSYKVWEVAIQDALT